MLCYIKKEKKKNSWRRHFWLPVLIVHEHRYYTVFIILSLFRMSKPYLPFEHAFRISTATFHLVNQFN